MEKLKKIFDGTLGWAIQPFSPKEGVILFILNKYHKGRVAGAITCNKGELKNLKRFMAERKFE
jgi:hypothetical protein